MLLFCPFPRSRSALVGPPSRFRLGRIGPFCALLTLLFTRPVATHAGKGLELLSRARPDWNTSTATASSSGAEVSADGRFVVFESAAVNLSPTPPAEGLLSSFVNVYV